jgi:multiple sugar transport system permease protein
MADITLEKSLQREGFMKNLNKKSGKIRTYVILLISAVLVIFPVAWIFSVSIRPNNQVFEYPASFIPKIFTLEAYIEVLTNNRYLKYFLNSYVIGMIVTIVSTVIGIMAGYGLSRYKFHGRKALSMFVVATQTVPKVALLIPFFIMMTRLHLYNTRLGLVLTYVSFALPYAIVMMQGYFNSVSTELDEAAIIDGLHRFRILWQIIVPVTIPAIISTMIYTFILSWNEFIFVMTLIQDDALRTIPVGIAMMKGETTYQWNTMMAMSLIGTLPVLLFYLIGQRYFISGLSEGSVKG